MKLNYKKYFIYVVCILFLIGVGNNYLNYRKISNIINDYKQINVALAYDYPPYVFRDGQGNLVGILVDEWNLWSIKTGIKVNLFSSDWSSAQDLIKERKCDVIDGIFKTAERNKIYDFSKPYDNIEENIFFDSKMSGITDINSLHGFKVAVEKGDYSVEVLKEKGIKDYVEYRSYEEIIKSVTNGDIKIFMMDKPPALYYIYKNGLQNQFKYTVSQYTGQLHRAVRKGDNKLLGLIEYGFYKISKSENEKIYNKWYGFQYVKADYSVYFMFGMGVIFVIALAMILLNIILNNRVKQKTFQLIELVNKLTKSENSINAILKANPDIFFVINEKYEFVDYKSNDISKLFFKPEKFMGKRIDDIFNEGLSKKIIDAIDKTIENDEMQIVEYSYYFNDENQYYEARILKYLESYVLVVVRDITEKKQNEIKMYEMSIKDSITGLYNRNYFENAFVLLKREALSSLCILMCDLDGLKFINDTLGHIAGDEYLKNSAQLLYKSFNQPNSIIARIGGDEFGIILTNIREEEVIKLRNVFYKSVNEWNKASEGNIPLSISVGYSFALEENIDIDKMVKEADDYMYRQKLQNKQSTKNDLVKVITKMLETRDFATEGHCERLQILGNSLAKKVGLSDREIQDTTLLCQFHDIGKIGISDSILFKKGKLTEEEYEEMKKHTEIGYRIAKSSPNIAHLSEYILRHHEWWNGKGYPFGLKEYDIPVQCRILSIVDAYDAMISDRPYRKAMNKAEAIDEIKRFSAIQFDPKLVDEFIDMITEEE